MPQRGGARGNTAVLWGERTVVARGASGGHGSEGSSACGSGLACGGCARDGGAGAVAGTGGPGGVTAECVADPVGSALGLVVLVLPAR
jgi:hypothetical protein